MSLNPHWEGLRYCPRCGAEGLQVDFPRSLRCPACAYRAFANPSPVACVVPRTEDGEVLLLQRGFEPGKGLWTFPGGFVDLGESVEDAARREVHEELEIDVELGRFVGTYSRAEDRVVLLVWEGRALGQPRTTPEAVAVRAFAPAAIPWHALAFWSTERALRDLLAA